MRPDRRSAPTSSASLVALRSALRRWWLDLDRGWRASVLGVLVVAAAIAF